MQATARDLRRRQTFGTDVASTDGGGVGAAVVVQKAALAWRLGSAAWPRVAREIQGSTARCTAAGSSGGTTMLWRRDAVRSKRDLIL